MVLFVTFNGIVYIHGIRISHGRGLGECVECLEHERQVHVLLAGANVDRSEVARAGHVVEGVAEPQQAAENDQTAATLKLQAPRSWRAQEEI